MKKKFTLTAALLLGFALSATAANLHSTSADNSVALRFYNGHSETVTITLYAGDNATNTVVVGSQSNTLDLSGAGADTIVEIVADILACTNSSGTALSSLGFVVDSDPSLAADSTDDELLDTQTITCAAKGPWQSLLWDTSTAKHYDVYLPDHLARPGVQAPYTVTRIAGLPSGTGDATTSVYLNGTLVWSQVDPAIVGTVTNQTININTELNIPVKASQALIVRSSRATTATTGVLSVITE